MKKVWSIAISLIMALTIFVVPNFGLAYADDEQEPEVNEASVTEENGEEEAYGMVKAQAAAEVTGLEVVAEKTTTSTITVKWDAVEGATYEYTIGDPTDDANWNPVEVESTEYEISGLTANTEYTIWIRAIVGEDKGEAKSTKGTTAAEEELVFPDAPAAVTGLKGTASITKKGVSTIAFSWKAVGGADGYAFSRYNGTIANGKYMDRGTAVSYPLKDYANKPLKQRTYYTLHVVSYVKLARQPEGEDEINAAEEAGAVKINPSGEYVMPSKTAATYKVKTGTVEKVVRTKYDKGYMYKYYDQNGVYRGTSYSMWNTIKNKKSKTKYLIALDTRRNNLVVYKGKKGNWKVYKHFVCATGMDGHRTPRGDFKVQRRKPKFQTGDKVGGKVVRAKYTCWYATKFKGACFFHSTLYHLNSKSRHAARHVGKHYSHGCVRLELKNAKWIYKNCKNGTAVISRKYGKDNSYGYQFTYKY